MANTGFLRVWIAGVVLLLAIIALTNVLVDPYDVFGSPRIAGINRVKPATGNHTRLSKTHQLARLHPVTVVLGTSRAEVGFDSASPIWPAAWRPVYNAGLPGVTLTGIRDMLAVAAASGSLRNAIVLLDFDSFVRRDTESDHASDPTWKTRASDMFLSVFTIGALWDSLATLAAQHAELADDLRPDGTTVEADFIRWARDEGYQELFDQKLELVAKQAASASSYVKAWRNTPNNMDVLSDIIRLCTEKNINLNLAFSPSHMTQQEIYISNGLLPALEDWKRAVLTLAVAEGKKQVRVWDFTGYALPNIEQLPAKGIGVMEYWWEPAHFTKNLGSMMIRKMTVDVDVDYGTEVTPETIDAVLRQYRATREAALCRLDARACPALNGQARR